MTKPNKFCGQCIKYPNKYSKHKCSLCKVLCCPHTSKDYESMNMSELLSKIDDYWYIIFICHDCIIKIFKE